MISTDICKPCSDGPDRTVRMAAAWLIADNGDVIPLCVDHAALIGPHEPDDDA